MGHVRLGLLPRSKAWKEVVGLIAAGADVSQVANATITAAENAFSFVMNDIGYTEAVWLMTQLAIAAKKTDILAHLDSVGISLPSDATLTDVTTSISEALDRATDASGKRSDLGELAGRALVGAVADALSPKLHTCFHPTRTRCGLRFRPWASKRSSGSSRGVSLPDWPMKACSTS